MEGQGLTNQRTEPHKSLISKNVSQFNNNSFKLQILWFIDIYILLCTNKKKIANLQTLKTKQRMLKEDWEFFKQRRFIEEQVQNKN